MGCYSHKQLLSAWPSEKHLKNPNPASFPLKTSKEKYWSHPGSPPKFTLKCINSFLLHFQACHTRKAQSGWDVCGCEELLIELRESHFSWKCAGNSREITGRLRWWGQEAGMGTQEGSDTFTVKTSLSERHTLQIALYLLRWRDVYVNPQTHTHQPRLRAHMEREQKECKIW